MKKNQSKSKSKVEERKSVANQCDYCRANGKCGRAMFDNYGSTCQGRSCEAWQCEAEGEEAARANDEATNCEFNRQPYGYCMNTKSKHYSNSCHKCNAFKEKCEAEGTAVTVVEAPSSKLQAQSYRTRVSEAYGRIETAKDNLLRECVKFGALLTEVGYYLGESRHAKNEGEGLKAWLEENCPEVNYSTAMNYKAMATKCVKMLGGGSQAVAVLQDKTEVIPPGEEEAVEVESKFIEKRDELFNEVKSRRELEQTYFKFMASEGKGGARRGRPAGTKADLSKKPDATDALAAARAAWSKIIVLADREAVALQAAAKLLNAEDVENAKIVLGNLIEMLKERAEELKIRI